uniref:Heat shock protein HspQ n=1 Tax=uncultured Thiotrichaceae bacterium TaxID=298394 RepID=A0A6S6SW01_9GAMM|nr:MAG: DNA-binding protein [uncultured Thiotrichaceae bacterium]
MHTKVNFAIGQIVHHLLFDYRGVIFDVDADFQGTEEWYEKNTSTGAPPKDEPWYHVLIDDDGRVAYVAQRNIESDLSKEPVEHPLLGNFFTNYEDGHYQSRNSLN